VGEANANANAQRGRRRQRARRRRMWCGWRTGVCCAVRSVSCCCTRSERRPMRCARWTRSPHSPRNSALQTV